MGVFVENPPWRRPTPPRRRVGTRLLSARGRGRVAGPGGERSGTTMGQRRRTPQAARQLRNGGASLVDSAALLDHEKRKTTAVYAQPGARDLERTVEQRASA